jgi:hypothetical protein
LSLIDWSDPEEMVGLLVEYVADERNASHLDPDRASFLDRLSREIVAVADRNFTSVEAMAAAMRDVVEGQPGEFANDPVMGHVEACIEELHRIARKL